MTTTVTSHSSDVSIPPDDCNTMLQQFLGNFFSGHVRNDKGGALPCQQHVTFPQCPLSPPDEQVKLSGPKDRMIFHFSRRLNGNEEFEDSDFLSRREKAGSFHLIMYSNRKLKNEKCFTRLHQDYNTSGQKQRKTGNLNNTKIKWNVKNNNTKT